MEYFELMNGMKIPVLGLGTYPMSNKEAATACRAAARIGYELFDTSTSYGNERGVGRGLRRGSRFVTTKVSNTDQRNLAVREACKKSCRALRTDRLDLYLLHWPQPGHFQQSWQVMEDLYREGWCRAIGVANFHVHHLEVLLETCTVAPMVNQIEIHPLLTQKEIIAFCQRHRIVCEAYSPFARMNPRLVRSDTLKRIAEEHGRDVTQIILRWNFQNGVISIPKTSSPQRMQSNIDIFGFALSDLEMRQIDQLNEDHRVRHNPDTCDFSKL